MFDPLSVNVIGLHRVSGDRWSAGGKHPDAAWGFQRQRVGGIRYRWEIDRGRAGSTRTPKIIEADSRKPADLGFAQLLKPSPVQWYRLRTADIGRRVIRLYPRARCEILWHAARAGRLRRETARTVPD